MIKPRSQSLKFYTLKLSLHVMWSGGLAPECVDSSFWRRHGIRSVSNGDVVLRTLGFACLFTKMINLCLSMTCVIRLDIAHGHDVTRPEGQSNGCLTLTLVDLSCICLTSCAWRCNSRVQFHEARLLLKMQVSSYKIHYLILALPKFYYYCPCQL